MNSTLRHGLLHQGFCCTTISDSNNKGHCRKFVNSLHQAFPSSLARSTSDLSKKTFTKFGVKSCNLKKVTSWAQSVRTLYMSPHSVLMTNPTEHAGKFNLDGNSELLIDLSAPVSGYPFSIDIRVTNTNTSLILHWGVIRDGQKNSWSLPSHRPDGTTVYKDRALITPFKRSDSNSILRIEIGDPQVKTFEFLIFDETRNTWFKNNGQNFCFSLQTKDNPKIDLLIPEDLVQIQAYLRWEGRGKQMYTPEQEKEEYDAARNDLLEEIARGVSIDDLRKRLTGNDRPNGAQGLNGSKTANVNHNKVPHELVQTQAYIRWERAGKPMYSQEKQLIEFEEARKELQLELDHGATVEEIRNRISKGNIQRKVSNQLQSKKYFTPERIQRKKRDVVNFINNVSLRIYKISDAPITIESANILELFLKHKEVQDGGIVLNKKCFKLGDKELLVFIIDLNGKVKAHIATTFEDLLMLHWGLSKKAGEWMVPPQNVLPEGTAIQAGACETQFAAGMYENSYIQNIEIDLGEVGFVGISFVLLSNGNWIKNGASDFYVGFNKESSVSKDVGDGNGTAKTLLDRIAEMESEAQKSFMHRFNIASDLIEEAKVAGELGLAGILVWMRFMATRQLIWNKNYNVKPREISKAQDRLTSLLQYMYRDLPQHREFVRMIMSTIGRGGEGDVGQRIRDEILVIQRNNICKGGMMEEWHQKLHNNTSPDDVIICQALIDYINSDFNINVYWNTLKSNGITKERLLSYDRAIHSEPNFQKDQKQGLLRDLGNYLRTLKAVHSGADLESAITTCLGYSVEGEGFMVGVQINPVAGLPSGFPALLKFIVDHLEDKWVEPLLEGLLEARLELQPLLLKDHDRLKDLIFLDLSLDSTVRTTIERGYEELNNAEPERLMYFVTLILQNLALSSDNNEDLIYCLKGWLFASDMCKRKDEQWALYAKSVLDRTRLALESKAHHYHQVLQPSAEYLGSLLGVEQWAINLFTEEIIRAGSAASLSGLLNRFDPILRKKANLGSWQIISPVEVVGYVVVVDDLLAVQNKSYTRPTILVAKTVKGEEEIPDGTVGVLTPDMPDVLSHVSVRARNGKVLFATCFDSNILNDLQGKEGKLLLVKPTSSNIIYSETKDSDINSETQDESFSTLSLVRKQFCGQYAISSQEFTSEMVGAKSRNISYLKGKVPSWVGIPTSVALPFGSFEKVLSEDSNKEVSEKLQSLKQCLEDGDFSVLSDIRSAVLQLTAPSELVQELKNKMQSSEMPWPGDEGEDRWNQAWMCIKKVWASKWNERAFFSTRKVKLNHDYLSMSVLVQEIISADYAFVIHTTNPSSGDSSEIYAEVVKGLGETLVGAYPGRALSFICKKNDLDSPKILGYPSKPIGLFIRQSIIFRSDSNGEDLDGYAGAGLYDSVPMDEEEKRVLDYTTDPLINDKHFKNSILSSIAKAGSVIEKLYGSPQDIEGVVKDGKIFVVQTRPQM